MGGIDVRAGKADDGKPVHARQHHLEDHHVEAVGLAQAQSLLTVVSWRHGVVFSLPRAVRCPAKLCLSSTTFLTA